MDLGIAGRTAIVCGGSAGLGRGAATALAGDGVTVYLAARDAERLATAAREIAAETSGKVHPVAADVTTEAGRYALLAACPQPDILINNAGGPPPGDFRSWSREDWIKAIDANMLSAIMLIKATIDSMIERRFGQIKQHDSFRRWTVWGLEAVRTQWSLLCTTLNLRVLYKRWRQNLPEASKTAAAMTGRTAQAGIWLAALLKSIPRTQKTVAGAMKRRVGCLSYWPA